MSYFVKRGEERFGPYTLADLQQYVQSGNITLQDLVQSEGSTDWVPLAQVLGSGAAQPSTLPPVQPPASSPVQPATYPPASSGFGGGYGAGAAAAPAASGGRIPLPSNMSWGKLLLLGIVTIGIVPIVFAFKQASWAQKLDSQCKALPLVAAYPIAVVLAILIGTHSVLGGLIEYAGIAVYLVGMFKVRSAMLKYYNSVERIGLKLGGVMTFFFNVIYFQYHINQIAKHRH